MKNKIVLAYSGGLDTSFCIKYLTLEKGFQVHSVCVNTGGFEQQQLAELEKKAYNLGVKNHQTIDITDEFYEKCVKYMIFGNVLRNNSYPLSVSSERVFQAMAVAKYAKEIDAMAVAHGCTGAGNDQVRFDMVFHTLIPEKEIFAPIRDLNLSREEEVNYLKKHGVDIDFKQVKYSINKGIWGTSIGGVETLASEKPLPEEAFLDKLKNTSPTETSIMFKNGESIQLNGEKLSPMEVIKKLQKLASQYAIGRGYNTGDTIIGIKGRIGFEAAAPLILIKAHQLLEKHNLTKWQYYWKENLSNHYGMMLHEGMYLDPVMRNIEQFLESSQQHISGKVFIRLSPYRFELTGIDSPHDLMNTDDYQYGESQNAWTKDEVKGFAKILATQTKIYYDKNKNTHD